MRLCGLKSKAFPVSRSLHFSQLAFANSFSVDELAVIQRANSTNPAVNYLIDKYDSVRDAAMKQAFQKIDSFLIIESRNGAKSKLPTFSAKLVDGYYESLQPVPWLQFHSPPISFIQFILNDATNFYLTPLSNSTQMVQLGKYASEVSSSIDILSKKEIRMFFPNYIHSFMFRSFHCSS